MAFCTNCGTELKGGKFCVNCGAAVDQPEAEVKKEEQAAPAPAKMGLDVKMLVWSIINTVLCCQILGIIALVFTILASETTDVEIAKKYLKTAKILNIVGIICMVLYILFIIAYVIIMIIFGGFMSLAVMSAMGMA